jgi:hypothetical protein
MLLNKLWKVRGDGSGAVEVSGPVFTHGQLYVA